MISKFDIINASAGSGKTFALTLRVLVKILKSEDENYFKRILALTFTNRAAEEMKSRILKALKSFSDSEIIINPSELFVQVKKELKFSSEKINRLSKQRLNLLLHNYSFFQIETLDSFNHHIIRSFSKELNLDPDFRVVIDTEEILDQSVSRVFENIEKNKEISNLLKEFSVRKISEGKSWDVEFDLKEFAQSILKENEISDIEHIENSSLKEFKTLKRNIEKKINDLNNKKNNVLLEIEKCISSQQI